MFISRSSLAAMRRMAPQPKSPRVERSQRRHSWSLRRAALGIELRGESLYLACVRPGWSRRWLRATAVVENFAHITGEQLRARISGLLAEAGVEDPIVVLGLPRREVMVRHIELPAAAAKQLESVLSLQLGMYKPSDEEEVAWDAAVVEAVDKLGIDLAFVAQNRVQELAALMRDAGYPIARLTSTQFATLDWMLRVRDKEDTGSQKRLMLIEARAGVVERSIAEGARCVFSRSFALPPNSDAAGHVATQVRQALATLRSLGSEPFRVLISGEGAEAWRGALEVFGRVEQVGSFVQTDALADPSDPAREQFWGALALAINGLSWTGAYRLNLLPRELRPQRKRWQNAPTYVLVAVNVLLLAALAGRAPLERHFLLKRYDVELAQMDRQAALVEREMKKSQAIEQQLATVRDFQRTGRQPLDALSDLAQKLPPDAWVSTFNYRQGQAEITGQAKSASALLPMLKQAPSIDDVQLRGGLTRDAGGERFQMQLKLRASR